METQTYRICKYCGELKPIEEFYKNSSNKSGYYKECKVCVQIKSKKYYEENKEKAKQYYKDNREKCIQYQRKYYEDNREKYIQYQREYDKINSSKLKDTYIKNNITKTLNIKSKDIPKELIEVKRTMLQTKRLIWKEIKQIDNQTI